MMFLLTDKLFYSHLNLIIVLFAYATTVLGYIWLVAISLIFLLISSYKCLQRRLNQKQLPPNQMGEIINNDQSKLYDGGDVANNGIIGSISTEEPNFCQIEESFDRWNYQNNFQCRANFHDSSVICEV